MAANLETRNAMPSREGTADRDTRRTVSDDKVLAICTAYEQGVGKGLARSLDRNPYGPGTDEYEAWGLGYSLGSSRDAASE